MGLTGPAQMGNRMRLLVIDGRAAAWQEPDRRCEAACARTGGDRRGTNAQATAAMLRAGADLGATGESAIRYQCRRADVIAGVTGILHANAMLGEISPAIAAAVSLSEAQKVLVPLERCGLRIAGVGKQPLDSLIREAARMICALCGYPVDGSEQEKRGEST